MNKTLSTFAFIGLGAIATPEAHSRSYICKQPDGMAIYLDDPSPIWGRDGLSKGSFIIHFGGELDSDVEVIVGDTRKSLKANGANFVQVMSDEEGGYDGLVGIYPDSGILDTYTVFQDDGQYRLAWTTFRGGNFNTQPTKTGSYIAVCEII